MKFEELHFDVVLLVIRYVSSVFGFQGTSKTNFLSVIKIEKIEVSSILITGKTGIYVIRNAGLISLRLISSRASHYQICSRSSHSQVNLECLSR